MSIPSLRTELCDLLGCRYPIIQTAMGWVSDARLVAATTNAGGFGFLAGATIPPDQVEAEILKVKSLTQGNFGINFHMFQPNANDIIDLAIKHGLKAVSYGRAPNSEMVKKMKAAGIVLMPTVGAVKHAQKAIELGADAVTVQGGEGGGHTGATPTTLLLPQVIEKVKVPVIAAGGFYNGKGLAAALAYGACGIAMGTRFLMTQESPVPSATLNRYLEVQDADRIRVSKALDGLPQRMIDNAFLQRLESASSLGKLWMAIQSSLQWRKVSGMSIGHILKTAKQAFRDDPATVSQLLFAANAPVIIQEAMVNGHPDQGVLPSGQVASNIQSLETVETVIHEIAKEAVAQLQRLQSLTQENPS